MFESRVEMIFGYNLSRLAHVEALLNAGKTAFSDRGVLLGIGMVAKNALIIQIYSQYTDPIPDIISFGATIAVAYSTLLRVNGKINMEIDRDRWIAKKNFKQFSLKKTLKKANTRIVNTAKASKIYL